MFKAFLECPARALALYRPRITGDPSICPTWVEKGSQAMACGSLMDAIVTKGLQVSIDTKSDVASLAPFLASSYDNGQQTAEWLLNKNGTFNASAKTTIAASERLLFDPVVQDVLAVSRFQERVSFDIADGWTWQGDIDILSTTADGTLRIIDLKHPGSTQDGWITSYGKNVKVPWYDAWAYWFQLAAYRTAIDAIPAYFHLHKTQGLLYVTREETPEVGYVALPEMKAYFDNAVNGQDAAGSSKLDVIRAIVEGRVAAPKCGKCDYCKAQSAVSIPSHEEHDALTLPDIDDKYSVNRAYPIAFDPSFGATFSATVTAEHHARSEAT